jgi:hypothetical protein
MIVHQVATQFQQQIVERNLDGAGFGAGAAER